MSDGLKEFWSWLDGETPAKCAPGTEFVPDPQPLGIGYAITGSGRRRRPSADIRAAILARQNDRCLYCEHRFGTFVRRRGRVISLRLHWDHFVPYAYGQTNEKHNWVAACHVCNGIKYCRMFDTVRDAQAYILARWEEKGYEFRRP